MKQILMALMGLTIFSCQEKPVVVHDYIQGDAFGTTYHIQLYSNGEIDFKQGIDSVITVVNHSLSTYIPDSDISKINLGDSTVVVDSLFREVFELSSEIHRKTDGYFDPTIGVLRNAYGFGDTKPLRTIDAETLDSLMQYVGFHKVQLKPDGTIRKEHPQIYFDFNAVAKGYGVDIIGRYLDSKGITDYLIEVGGEILAKGKNIENEKAWSVGIESPDSELENRSYEATVLLGNVGLAASGNYRKFRIDPLTGKKYVHSLNPLSGSAEMSNVTSATVIAPTCAEADAYATAFMVLGLQKSKDLLNELPKIEAYLTYTDSLSQHAVFVTDGFKKMMPEQ